MDNPMQFIKDRAAIRPYNENDEKDGNWQYIHRTDAWSLAEEINRLREELEAKNDTV